MDFTGFWSAVNDALGAQGEPPITYGDASHLWNLTGRQPNRAVRLVLDERKEDKAPAYEQPVEQEAWSEGYDHGRAGDAMRTDHTYPNAYARGFWDGNAARSAAIAATRPWSKPQ